MQPRPSSNSYAVELQALEDYRNFSATTIQRYYRGWICRAKQKWQSDASLQQQKAAEAESSIQQHLYKAARTIQDGWRNFNNKRIYRYYKDLIRFKEAGDPRQMLRCINAREAALIDPAAGLHVRFRLGGSSFPPLVFYKIYTHRPVADIGAFGPRNYAAEDEEVSDSSTTSQKLKASPATSATCKSNASSSSRRAADALQHAKQTDDFELPARLREYIKPDGTLGYRSTRGWYRRQDRNGWRPVAERLLLDQQHQAALPAGATQRSGGKHRKHRHRRRQRLNVHGIVGVMASKQQLQERTSSEADSACEGDVASSEASSSGRGSPVFHYNPVVRREERARQLKQRRRQWLLKMYRTGMCVSASGGSSAHGVDKPFQDGSSTAAAAGGLVGDGSLQHSTITAGARRRSATEEENILQALEQQLTHSEAACASSGFGSGSSGAVATTTDDWDVEALAELGLDAGILAWSQKLDFDSYQQHWNSTAVTLGSAVLVPENEKLLLQQLQQALQ